jgi:hypothetical protein
MHHNLIKIKCLLFQRKEIKKCDSKHLILTRLGTSRSVNVSQYTLFLINDTRFWYVSDCDASELILLIWHQIVMHQNWYYWYDIRLWCIRTDITDMTSDWDASELILLIWQLGTSRSVNVSQYTLFLINDTRFWYVKVINKLMYNKCPL